MRGGFISFQKTEIGSLALIRNTDERIILVFLLCRNSRGVGSREVSIARRVLRERSNSREILQKNLVMEFGSVPCRDISP